MPPMGAGGGSLFTPDPRDSWWPKELGSPSAIGAQNDVRYAFFPAVGRLAVEANGQVNVYDTGEHHIAGFSQQQSPGGAVVFSTPGGSVSLANLSPVAGGISQQAQSSGGGSQQQQVSTGMAPMPAMGSMAPMGVMGSMGGMAPMDFAPMGIGGALVAEGTRQSRRHRLPERAALRLLPGGPPPGGGGEREGECARHRRCADLRLLPGQRGRWACVSPAARGPSRLSSLPEVRPAGLRTRAKRRGLPMTPGRATCSRPWAGSVSCRDRGILTEEEFAAKKADLLSRL